MRSLLLAGTVCLGALCATGARADTTYSLTLTPDPGTSFGGSGSLSLSVAPSATGVTDYYAAGNPANNGTDTLDALALTVDGLTFGIGNETSGFTGPLVEFTSGVLTGVDFDGELFTGSDLYALDSSGLTYSFVDLFGFQSGTGTIALNTSTNVTPEPSGLILMGTGLLAGMATLRRRLA